VLANPGSPYTQEFRSQRDSTARSLGMELPLVEVKGRGELAAAFDRIGSMEVGGILVLSDIVFVSNPWAIVELVARLRIPAIYPDRAFVDAGGLMFYGAALPVMYRHAAAYVDKIRKRSDRFRARNLRWPKLPPACLDPAPTFWGPS
jgi:putative ABC transport system substrate-binding protein